MQPGNFQEYVISCCVKGNLSLLEIWFICLFIICSEGLKQMEANPSTEKASKDPVTSCGWTESCTTWNPCKTIVGWYYRGIESFQGCLGGARFRPSMWECSPPKVVRFPTFHPRSSPHVLVREADFAIRSLHFLRNARPWAQGALRAKPLRVSTGAHRSICGASGGPTGFRTPKELPGPSKLQLKNG